MLRFIIFFLKLFFVLGVALFIAYTPGEIVLEWQGYRIHTTFGVFLGGLFLLSSLFTFIYLFGQYFWSLPKRFIQAHKIRRFNKGYNLLLTIQEDGESTKNSTSIAQAQKLQTLLPSPVLGLCLEAETYEKQGEPDKAHQVYTKISLYKGGEYLGFFNLARLEFKKKEFDLAKQNALSSLQYKEHAPASLFLLACIALEKESFQEAASYAEKLKPINTLQKQQKNQLKAYIWYKKAEQQEISTEERLELLSYAYDFNPSSVAITLAYVKMLVKEGKISKACKVLENNWKETEDREVGSLYISLGIAGDALEAFRKAKYLKELKPNSVIGALLVAEAALHSKLWGEARASLETISSHERGAYYYSLQSQIMEKEGENPVQVLSVLQENLKNEAISDWKCKCCSREEAMWVPFCIGCYEMNCLKCE